jgi:Uma2 family endonuclease
MRPGLRDDLDLERRWSVADLDSIPEADDGTRYEIIAGRLYVSPSPHLNHQLICAGLIHVLMSWNGGAAGKGRVVVAADVVASEQDLVVPDVFWVSAEHLDRMGSDGRLHGAPDLVIEVLSRSTEARDRTDKVELYSKLGVGEYWIVDWRRRCIEVFRRDLVALRSVVLLTPDGVLESPNLPGLRMPLAGLFEAVIEPRRSAG